MTYRALYVNYWCPEDGDTEGQLNMWRMQGQVGQITVREIQQSFPLPGTYHFRFKDKFANTYVWLDMENPDEVAPDFDGSIVLKVSREQWPKRKSSERRRSSRRPSQTLAYNSPEERRRPSLLLNENTTDDSIIDYRDTSNPSFSRSNNSFGSPESHVDDLHLLNSSPKSKDHVRKQQEWEEHKKEEQEQAASEETLLDFDF